MNYEQMVDERDALLEVIVAERVNAELPGEGRMVAFARNLTLSALLGRFPANGSQSAPPAESAPLPFSLSPAPPVETAPTIRASDAEAPGTPPGAGETPEAGDAPTPPPGKTRRPRNGQRNCPAHETSSPAPAPSVSPTPAAPVPYQAESGASVTLPMSREPEPEREASHVPGSCGALYETRCYVLNCVEKRQAVNLRVVMNLTGWDRPTANKFVHELQDEGKRVQSKVERVTANMESLLAAIEATPDDEDEDSDEDAAFYRETEPDAPKPEAEPEKAFAKSRKPSPKPTAPTGAGTGKASARPIAQQKQNPSWWKPELARTCPQCGGVIQPRYYEGSRQWEAKSMYDKRATCGKQCPKGAWNQTGLRSSAGANFPDGETAQAGQAA